MTTISSLGVGSGLDAESIIKALVSSEKAPIQQLSDEKDTMTTKLSSIGKLKSLASAMRDSADDLADPTLWRTKTLSSADDSTVSGTVAVGATSGIYNVSVQSLATAQTVTSSQFSSASSTLSAGTLTIQLGTWSSDGSTFTAKSGSTASTITIDASSTSLTAIRDKINDAAAGVTATIVNDSSGARLSIRSTESGAANGFRITASETTADGDDSTGLSALSYNPAGTTSEMTLNQSSADAAITINGISVTSTTNTFENVVDGLTLTAGKVSSSDVAVTVSDDTDGMEKVVKSFVSAFNDLSKYIKDQTKYDAAAKKASPLQGDGTTVNFQRQLRNIINTTSTASTVYSRLSDIGITMAEDGTLSIKTSKLEAALKKPDEVRKLLATDGSTSASSGFADRFRDLANQVLGPEGSIQLSEDGLNAKIKRNQDRQDELTRRADGYEARLRKQFESLDTTVSKYNSLNSYVSNQMSALAKNTTA